MLVWWMAVVWRKNNTNQHRISQCDQSQRNINALTLPSAFYYVIDDYMRTTDPSRLMVIQTKMAVVMTTSICFECALIIYFPIIFIWSLSSASPSISFFCASRSDSFGAKRHTQLLKSAFTWGYKHTPLLRVFFRWIIPISFVSVLSIAGRFFFRSFVFITTIVVLLGK